MNKTYYNDEVNYINVNKIKVKNNRNYNIVSLFSGVGGMDLGFIGNFNFLNQYYSSNPFTIKFSNDIFKQAAQAYESNFKQKVHLEDISELDLNILPKDDIDVVLGGFPCQTFSYAGKRKGLSDPRGQLYLQMIRVINHCKPKLFVAENVDGIRNSRKNKDGENVNTSALDVILSDFDKAGYNVQYHVLNAADYGVPQTRRRVIILGIRKDLGSTSDVYYPLPEYSKDGIDDLWDKVNSPSIANHTDRDISKAKFYPGKNCKVIIE